MPFIPNGTPQNNAGGSFVPNTPEKKGFLEKAGSFIGGGTLAKGLGTAIFNTTKSSKALDDVRARDLENQNALITRINEKKARGEDVSALKNVLNQTTQSQQQNNAVAKNIQTGGGITPRQVIGSGIQLGANFVGAGGASQVASNTVKGRILQGIGQGALSGATAGGVYGLGAGIEDKNASFGDVVKETAISGAVGGALGGFIGGAIPTAGAALRKASKLQRTFIPTAAQKANALPQLQKEISQEVDNLVSSRGINNAVQKAKLKNTNVVEYLKDPEIFTGLKVENKRINPDQSIDIVDNRIEQLMSAKRSALPEIDKYAPKQSKEALRQRAIDAIPTNITEADKRQIIRAIDGQLAPLPNEFTVSQLDAERARFRGSARNAQGILKRNTEYAALENGARDLVFDATDNLPFDTNGEFKRINDEVKSLINTKTFLDKTIRGQVVKGGRLAEYSARFAGAVAGSSGGPLGTIMGAEAGGAISRILTDNQLGSAFKLNAIKGLTKDPAIIREAEIYLNNVKNYKPLNLPAPSANAPRTSINNGGQINLPERLPKANFEPQAPVIDYSPINQRELSSNISRQNTATNIISNPNSIYPTIPQNAQTSSKVIPKGNTPSVNQGKIDVATLAKIGIGGYLPAAGLYDKVKESVTQGGTRSYKQALIDFTENNTSYKVPNSDKSTEQQSDTTAATTTSEVMQQSPKEEKRVHPSDINSYVPDKYTNIIKDVTKDSIISANALTALINTENGMWDESFVNPKGSDTGLGQFNDNTYTDANKLFKKKYGRDFDRKNGEDSIKASLLWLEFLADKPHIYSIDDVVGAYRVGSEGFRAYKDGKGTKKFTAAQIKSMVEDKQKSFREFYDSQNK